LRENADLKDRTRRLHTDDVFLEQLARDRLILVREHDIVYRFHPTKPSLTQ
jgi:cell division protein FtsB